MSKGIQHNIFVWSIYFSALGILKISQNDVSIAYLLEIAIFPTHLISRIIESMSSKACCDSSPHLTPDLNCSFGFSGNLTQHAETKTSGVDIHALIESDLVEHMSIASAFC